MAHEKLAYKTEQSITLYIQLPDPSTSRSVATTPMLGLYILVQTSIVKWLI